MAEKSQSEKISREIHVRNIAKTYDTTSSNYFA